MIKKIIKHKKTLTLLGIVFLALSLPRITYGVVGTGFFDVFKAMHSGLSEVTGPVLGTLITAAIAYVIGMIFVYFAGIFLEQSILFSMEALTIHAPIVEFGWTFVVGIANMAIILALLIAGITLILKLENINAKKLITNAIIIALLMNFTLVFVGMGIDISNIFYRTILNEVMEKGALGQVVTMIVIETGGLAEVAILFGVLAVQAAIPISSPFWQAAVLSTTGVVLLPQVIAYLMQTILFFLLGTMLLLFAVIFIARVFVVQILAILSPIAFACLALPQQKKNFDLWLKYFVGWLFSGIFFLFFLAIGFQLSKVLDMKESAIHLPLGISLSGTMLFFIYLGIYFAVVLFVGKSSIPQGAAAIVSVTENAIKRGAPKMAELGTKAGLAAGVPIREKTSRVAETMMEKGGIGALAKSEGKNPVSRWAQRRASMLKEGQLDVKRKTEDYQKKRLAEESLKYAGTSVEQKELAIGRGDMGALVQAMEEGQMDKISVRDETIVDIGKKLADVNAREFTKLYQTVPHLADKISEALTEERRKAFDLKRPPSSEEERAILDIKKGAPYLGTIAGVISKMKPDDISNMSKDAMKDKRVILSLIGSQTTTDQAAAYMKSASKEAREEFVKVLKETGGVNQLEINNPGTANWIKSNAGIRALGMKVDQGSEKEEEEERSRSFREEFLRR